MRRLWAIFRTFRLTIAGDVGIKEAVFGDPSLEEGQAKSHQWDGALLTDEGAWSLHLAQGDGCLRYPSQLWHGGRVMDLPKVCKDVRGAPRSCPRTGPARQSAMGVAEVEAHGTACLYDFGSLLPDRGASQWMIPFSIRVQGSETASQASRATSFPHSRPDAQAPGEKAEHMDVMVVSNRIVPSHQCGMRASWRTDKQRPEPEPCRDCALQFPFPQGSRHLPFPFGNARVKVGRTVMEG